MGNGQLNTTQRDAITGAVGGAGAVAGGGIAILFDGNLILALLLATASGAILSGSLMLYISFRRGSN